MKKRIFLLLILVVMIYGCAGGNNESKQLIEPPVIEQPDIAEEIIDENAVATNDASVTEEKSKTPEWTYGGPAIEGNYADSDFVDLGNGKYRIYYAIEPEVPNNKLEVYSAISSDGINWVPESGVRRTFTVFPDVVQLSDGKWRMYFQNGGVIKSAKSTDGIRWTDESGTRMDTKNNAGLALNRVSAPTTIVDGNNFIMVYSGAIAEPYPEKVPNPEMAVLLWATSANGLEFEVQGIAVDSRKDPFLGWVDGPDLIKWDDGTIKLFFWGYFGIYESTFTGTGFTEPVMVYEAKDEDPMHRFPSSPPGDPTLGKVGSKWFMYYGQHTKGIYYALLENEALR